MRLRFFKMIFCIAFLFDAAGFAHADDIEIFGTAIGATMGGVFGSEIGHGGGQLAATSIGVTAGGLIGNDVGHAIEYDNRYAPSSALSAPASSYNASTPLPPYTYRANYVAPPAPSPLSLAQGARAYCQRYSQIITVGGRVQQGYGIACLQADGSWRTVP
jgi:surface antigen